MDTDYRIIPGTAGEVPRLLWNAAHDANVSWPHWSSQIETLCRGAGETLDIHFVGTDRHRPAEWARWIERSATLFTHFGTIRWIFDDPELEARFRAAGLDLLGRPPQVPGVRENSSAGETEPAPPFARLGPDHERETGSSAGASRTSP
jgi:hypothetical protein